MYEIVDCNYLVKPRQHLPMDSEICEVYNYVIPYSSLFALINVNGAGL